MFAGIRNNITEKQNNRGSTNTSTLLVYLLTMALVPASNEQKHQIMTALEGIAYTQGLTFQRIQKGNIGKADTSMMKQTHYKVMALTHNYYYPIEGKSARDSALGTACSIFALLLRVAFKRMVGWFNYCFTNQYNNLDAVRNGITRHGYTADGALKDMNGINILPKIVCEYDAPKPPSLKHYITPGDYEGIVKRLKSDIDLLENSTVYDTEDETRIRSLPIEGMRQEVNDALELIQQRMNNYNIIPSESRVTVLKALKVAANFLDLGEEPNEDA